jgi:hypothetical protein
VQVNKQGLTDRGKDGKDGEMAEMGKRVATRRLAVPVVLRVLDDETPRSQRWSPPHWQGFFHCDDVGKKKFGRNRWG